MRYGVLAFRPLEAHGDRPSATAEDLSSRLSPINAAVALVGADTAAEAVLGILADRSGATSAKRDPHEELLVRAMAAAATAGGPLEATLVRAIRLTHQRRNAVVHQGDDATPRDVEDGIVVVRGLLAVNGKPPSSRWHTARPDVARPHPVLWFALV